MVIEGWKHLRAGRLRHRVSIQSVGTSYDGYGDLSDSWTTDATVWASVSPTSGDEKDIASENTGIDTHTVKIRYRAGITSQNRILFGSRVFQIQGVKDWNEYKAGRCLEMFCKEVTT
jgi:SPP1 family predicted phage head-tail adaptor